MADRPAVLAIAGSDSSGGAGLTADQRAIEDQGARILPVVTAVTAQGPGGVTHIHPVPIENFRAQLLAALAFEPRAIKVGMLATGAHVDVVAQLMKSATHVPPVIIDPVLASTSGTALLDPGGIDKLALLTGLTALWTPNQQELARLGNMLDNSAVLVTGGDVMGTTVVDVLRRPGHGDQVFSRDRIPGPSPRGTGCTLASAIAAQLAVGQELHSAVARGIGYTAERIVQSVEP